MPSSKYRGPSAFWGSMSVFVSGIGNGKGPVSPDTSVIWLHLDVSVQFSTPKSSAEKKKLKKGLARCKVIKKTTQYLS